MNKNKIAIILPLLYLLYIYLIDIRPQMFIKNIYTEYSDINTDELYFIKNDSNKIIIVIDDFSNRSKITFPIDNGGTTSLNNTTHGIVVGQGLLNHIEENNNYPNLIFIHKYNEIFDFYPLKFSDNNILYRKLNSVKTIHKLSKFESLIKKLRLENKDKEIIISLSFNSYGGINYFESLIEKYNVKVFQALDNTENIKNDFIINLNTNGKINFVSNNIVKKTYFIKNYYIYNKPLSTSQATPLVAYNYAYGIR